MINFYKIFKYFILKILFTIKFFKMSFDPNHLKQIHYQRQSPSNLFLLR
jgi:hypothetical protein